jgi:RHS repeat-associated protein
MDDADNLIGVYLTDGSDPEILIESSLPDADGNMLTRTNEITDEVITYGWNDFDRLIRVSSADSGGPTSTVKENNRYDINGIRKRKLDKNGSGSHEYTAGISTVSSKAVSSSSSAPTISYLQGHQILGAEVNGVWQYWLGDHLGSIRETVNDTGTVIRSQEFGEHGQLLNSSGTGTFAPKTYQGALSVNDDTTDSGLYMMGHRHYASELGRFISRDPIGFRGGLNLFSGAGTSPVTIVDPSGLTLEFTGQQSGYLVALLERLTGLTFFNKGEGLQTACDLSGRESPNPALRQLLLDLMSNPIHHTVEVDYLSETPFGRFIGSARQKIDVGDMLTAYSADRGLAGALIGHELTELFESSNAALVPTATRENWWDVFAKVHERGLEFERGQGYTRTAESYNETTGEGSLTFENQGTYDFKNKKGSFRCRRR